MNLHPHSHAHTRQHARSTPLCTPHSRFSGLSLSGLAHRHPGYPKLPGAPCYPYVTRTLYRYLLLYLTRVLQSLLTQRTTFGKSPPAPGPRQGSTSTHTSYRRPTPFRLGSDTTVQMKYRSCRDAPTREDGMSGCSSRSSFLILCRARFAAFGAPVLLAGRGAAEPPRRPHLIHDTAVPQPLALLWQTFLPPSPV